MLYKSSNKLNSKVVKVKKRNNNTIFLSKFKDLVKFKILCKFKITKAIKKPNFLTSNTRKIFNFLK